VRTARLEAALGQSLYSVGDYAGAQRADERALVIWERVLGPEHPDVATGLNNLAELYDDQGRYAEAEPLYQRALALREQALGPTHPDLATSLNNLAVLYNHQGRYAEAEPVGSKNSCGLAVVVLEQPAEPFATLNRAFTLLVLAGRRKEHDVALPLVWAFFMVMGDILVKGMPQRLLPKQDQPRQRFVLDGADPSFRVSI